MIGLLKTDLYKKGIKMNTPESNSVRAKIINLCLAYVHGCINHENEGKELAKLFFDNLPCGIYNSMMFDFIQKEIISNTHNKEIKEIFEKLGEIYKKRIIYGKRNEEVDNYFKKMVDITKNQWLIAKTDDSLNLFLIVAVEDNIVEYLVKDGLADSDQSYIFINYEEANDFFEKVKNEGW